MIEIPRAALTADEIAKEAEFFCFGTNDLTQMTYGFSSDDAGKFLDAYYDAKIFENDPFAKLDQIGVGKLMEMAIKLGKSVQTRPPRSVSAASTAAILRPLSSATRSVLTMYRALPSECRSQDLRLLRLTSRTPESKINISEYLQNNADTPLFPERRKKFGHVKNLTKISKKMLSCIYNFMRIKHNLNGTKKYNLPLD